MKNSNNFFLDFKFINPFRSLYKKIRENEERKQKTVLFGLLSILFSCVCVGLCYPCVLLGVKGVIYGFTHFLGVFTYLFAIGHIFILVGSFGVILLPYYFWLQGIQLVIMQLCLNRKLVSWLALIIWIVCFAGIFLLSLESFLVVTGSGHVFQ